MSIHYYKSGKRIIRALSIAVVRKLFPDAVEIERSEALAHERTGEAILMLG